MAKKINKNEVGLTETQKEILRKRKRINRRELEAEKLGVFGKYKVITYIWVFLCPPYALYRIHKKDSPFTYTEKWAQTIVALVYMVCLIDLVIKLI